MQSSPAEEDVVLWIEPKISNKNHPAHYQCRALLCLMLTRGQVIAQCLVEHHSLCFSPGCAYCSIQVKTINDIWQDHRQA